MDIHNDLHFILCMLIHRFIMRKFGFEIELNFNTSHWKQHNSEYFNIYKLADVLIELYILYFHVIML